jgi:hypothetical protein
MPRKGPAPKRPLVNDPVYSSPLVTQLVNKVLKDGKRSLAERIVYAALEGTRDKTGTDPVADIGYRFKPVGGHARRPSATNGVSTLRGDEESACAHKLDLKAPADLGGYR